MSELPSVPREHEAYAHPVDPTVGEYFDDNNFLPHHKVENNLLRTINKLVVMERDEKDQKLSETEQKLYETERRDSKFPMYLNSKAWNEDMNARIWEGQTVGVVFMDFDGFKAVNDELGHGVGDMVIADFGEHMNTALRRETDTMGMVREGGDEFGIVFGIDSNERRTPNPKKRVRRTRKYLQQQIYEFIDNHSQKERLLELGFGVSFGIAVNYAQFPRSIDELKKEVDDNMYKGKRAKRERLATSLGGDALVLIQNDE